MDIARQQRPRRPAAPRSRPARDVASRGVLSRRARAVVGPLGVLGVLLSAAVGSGLLAGCSADPPPSRTEAAAGIGAWPTFLPSPTPAAQARGSVADPALSYAGSPVLVSLATGTVTVDVEGPSYPSTTKVGADRVPCTFDVVLSGATAPVPLRSARFDVLDHTGVVHVLQARAGAAVPDRVEPGQTLTLHLVATVPSGEGLLRYAPDGSGTAAAWDYVAETD